MRPAAPSSFVTKSKFAPSAFQAIRCYSADAGLSKTEVEGRIVDLLKNFDKVRFSLPVPLLPANVSRRSPTLQKYDEDPMPC